MSWPKVMPHLLPLATAWLAFAGCNAEHSPPEKAKPFRAAILLSDSQPALEAGMTSTRFQLATLRDLFVRVQVANPPSMTMLELQFTSPVGERFYETRSLFSTDPTIVNLDDPVMGPSRAFPMKSIPGGFA